MTSTKIIAAVTAAVLGLALLNTTAAAPDSAGIVEMFNGLAYGGIPYGSVSGMLSKYTPPVRQPYYAYNSLQQPGVLLTDTRTARLAGVNPAVGY